MNSPNSLERISDIGHDVDVSGHLFKRRGGFGKHMPNNWQQRYFTLKDGVMCYYDVDDEEHKVRGKLDMKSVVCDFHLGANPENAPTLFTMQISPQSPEVEKWKLCAETKDELQKWSTWIEKYAENTSKRRSNSNASEPDGTETYNDSILLKSVAQEILSSPDAGKSASMTNITSPLKASSTPKISSTSNRVKGNAASTTVVSNSLGSGDSNFNSVMAQPGQRVKPKKSLKLKTAAFSDELETLMVIIILNACAFIIIRSSYLVVAIFYVLVLNFVVVKTLFLRSGRVKAALAQQAQIAKDAAIDAPQTLSRTSSTAAVQKALFPDALSTVSESSGAGGPQNSSSALDVLPAHAEKPGIGTTVVQVFALPPNVPDHTWCKCDYRQFNVRVGPEYTRFKKKAASGPPLYEAVAVDAFCTKLRMDNVQMKMSLPDIPGGGSGHPHVPELMIVQIQFPSEPPPLFGSVEDGPGWAIVMTYRLSKETKEHLKNLATAPPAVKLFAKWCEKAPTDPAWRGRFKVINSCSNLEELGVPQFIVSYNAKPVLIRKTGTLFRGKDSLEMDIHVHKFAAVAKRSIHLLSSKCGQMYMQIGFVIEGREDNELPECLFACVGVNRPQEDKAEFLFDNDDDI